MWEFSLGTFLCDCVCERRRLGLSERTTSLWSHLNRPEELERHLNCLYEPNRGITWPSVAPVSLVRELRLKGCGRFWPGLKQILRAKTIDIRYLAIKLNNYECIKPSKKNMGSSLFFNVFSPLFQTLWIGKYLRFVVDQSPHRLAAERAREIVERNRSARAAAARLRKRLEEALEEAEALGLVTDENEEGEEVIERRGWLVVVVFPIFALVAAIVVATAVDDVAVVAAVVFVGAAFVVTAAAVAAAATAVVFICVVTAAGRLERETSQVVFYRHFQVKVCGGAVQNGGGGKNSAEEDGDQDICH